MSFFIDMEPIKERLFTGEALKSICLDLNLNYDSMKRKCQKLGLKRNLEVKKPENDFCKNCGKSLTSKDNRRKFCSRSCSTAYNNKLHPKIKAIQKYCECGNPKIGNRKFCKQCIEIRHENFLNLTLDELRTRRQYQAHAGIRDHSRDVYKKHNGSKICSKCGYTKHIEVCHIKAIDSFSLTATIRDINNISNLVGLCPNCHWELDNGFLTL